MKKSMKTLLPLTLLLALLMTLWSGTVLAEGAPLPQRPTAGAYGYSSGLQLTEATAAQTTTEAKKAVRVQASLKQTAFDISEYDYLHVWIYVSDAALLYDNNGDGLELSSGGKQDKEESALYFSYTKAEVPTVNGSYARLETGWNEYLLKLADFQVATGGTLDPTKLNYIGLVLRSNPAGLTFAMSEIYAVKAEDVFRTSMGAFPSDSGIPQIPIDARYELADTALQLTAGTEYGTAGTAGSWFRMVPERTAPSLDLTEYQYIYLWIYITKADLHNGDSIEFCSGGGVDRQENAVRFNSWHNAPLQEGWNECLIPLSSFSYATGDGWQLDAINFISVVLRSKSDIQTGAISRIYAVKESEITDLDSDCPVSEPIPVESARYTLLDTALQLTTKPVWGTTAAAGKHVRLAPALMRASFDLSEYDYIYTWLYLSADDLAAGDGVELTSGGTNDKEENAIRFLDWAEGGLHVGWNELMICLDDFKYTTGGSLDPETMNFIGVVFRSQSGVMMGMVSEIYALTEADFVDLQPQEDTPLTGNGKIGRGDLVWDFGEAAASEQTDVLSLSAQLNEVVQPGRYTYVCAEIYVENKTLLSRKGGALYISSSPEAQVQELSYTLTRQQLYEGWNTVFLPVESFCMSGLDYDDPGYGGICDLLQICRIGVSWALRSTGGDAEPVLRLGRIYLTNSSVTEPLPQGAYILRDSAMAITTGEVSASVSAGSSPQLARLVPEINYGENDSVDISGKQYLYFWLYVSNRDADDSTVSDNELELCSGGKCDEEENAIRLYRISETWEPWLMSGEYGSFETGWNEYAVPISDLTRLTNKSGSQDTGCDYSALNYLRIFFHTGAGMEAEDVTYAISTVYAINPWDLSQEGESLPDLRPVQEESGSWTAGTEPDVAAASLHFTDVSADAWYYAEVTALVHDGLMNGVSETVFAPEASVSRAMLVTVLHRAVGCPAADGDPFLDVPPDQWYTEAVLWATETGVIQGYGDGLFGPQDAVTREQIAAVLWRLSGAPAPSGDFSAFTDSASVPEWARDAMAWCVEKGILNGSDNGTLEGARAATRAEIAVILYRYLYAEEERA